MNHCVVVVSHVVVVVAVVVDVVMVVVRVTLFLCCVGAKSIFPVPYTCTEHIHTHPQTDT